jgi:hypothetical protein
MYEMALDEGLAKFVEKFRASPFNKDEDHFQPDPSRWTVP